MSKEKKCCSKLATRPIFYTDTIKGEQVCRDDMWAVTTEELNSHDQLVEAVKDLRRAGQILVDSYPAKEGWWCPHCGETDCSYEGNCTKCGCPIENQQSESLLATLITTSAAVGEQL